jgi:arylsulfatase A-like enzyme
MSRWKSYLKKLLTIIASHPLIYKIALNAYSRYRNPRLKREFRSRINQINAAEYLDVSHEPNLNVIILVVDCLRNSQLSCQGYFRETTPFLDLFKTRFCAISAAPWTYSSVASILTGLYPHNHKAIITGDIKHLDRLENFQKLRGDILTLPEMLYLLGYRIYFGTAISLASDALRARIIPQPYPPSSSAGDVLNDLTKWISKKNKKFFAYIQLGDLHTPLNPPDDFRHFFGDVSNLHNIDNWNFMTHEQREADKERFQEYKESRQLLYDNTLRYVDYAIEGFYNSLKDMGLAESTVLLVTADHGDQFWEHADLEATNFHLRSKICGVSHGQNVFNEIIQVPLLMSGPVPSIKPDHCVSTVDIVPTVVDLLGIGHKMRFDGRNIFKTEGEVPLLSESCRSGYEKKALIIGTYKLLYSEGDGIEWVFDLEKDPYEQHPIVDKEVTSTFVDKLLHMLKEDEKRNIREIARKKFL